MGNALNMADMSPIKDFNHQLSSLTGKVKLYVSNDNLEFLDITMMRPAMIAEAPVSETIQPVLEALADNYSPVQGMGCITTQSYFSYTNYFLDKKQRIYVHDNGYWMVKGRFEKAFTKDSKIAWDVDEENLSLSVLAVSLSIILCWDCINLMFCYIDLF